MKRALLALATACWGCGHANAPSAVPAQNAVDDATVAAMVNGVPIRTAQVKAQAEAAGMSARDALAALVDAELAAQEAERRGYQRDAEVRYAADQVIVPHFLRDTFERTTADVIPENDVRRVYDRAQIRFDHPPLVEVDHILFQVAKNDAAPRRAALRARATLLAERAAHVKSRDEFAALAEQFSDGEIKPRYEKGFVTAEQGWATSPPFARAAFKIRDVGATSPVVESDFGYHVIFLVQRMPEEHLSYLQARDKVREMMWPEARKREFARFVDRVAASHTVALHPDRLESDRGETP